MTKRKQTVDEEGQVAQNLVAAAGRREDLIQQGWLGWHDFLHHPPNQPLMRSLSPSGAQTLNPSDLGLNLSSSLYKAVTLVTLLPLSESQFPCLLKGVTGTSLAAQ